MVFDLAIGLHHVGADLAAERNVHLGFVEPVGFRFALLNFEIVEAERSIFMASSRFLPGCARPDSRLRLLVGICVMRTARCVD